MLRFLVLTTALMAAQGAQERPQRSYNHFAYSAASEGQIKNAIENNYDDTGPGAKIPDRAYKTYSNLEDALLNYLDDPETKLPDHERAKAVNRLIRPDLYSNPEPIRYLPKFTNEYSKIKTVPQADPLSLWTKIGYSNNRNIFHQYLPYRPQLDFRGVEGSNLGSLQNYGLQNLQTYPKQIIEPHKLHTIQGVKSSPISLAHFTKAQDLDAEYNPNPQYSFSYGVNDKLTGDSKSAHESRDGGVVRGFYSFMDADGKQRTVRYTADDEQGFRATVERTDGSEE